MRADVCFVVEGSYPYVAGGVASWVHQLITNLPDLTFALLCLVPDESFPRVDKYALPSNVVARQDVFLFAAGADDGARREPSAALVGALEALHGAPPASRCPFVRGVEALMRSGNQTATTLMTSRGSWRLIEGFYDRQGRTVSILDYFWTWRGIHGPMFRLLDAPLPDAAVYHPVSTGYAGFMAGLAKLRGGAGLVLTEHGLYTREREIEIANAAWIYLEPTEGTSFAPHELFFKGWWRNQYRFLGQLSYDLADRIVTLHEANRLAQIAAGASPDKLVIVPNGIDPDQFRPMRVARAWADRPFRVALIGRVVPIKDVKTFIRAIHLAGLEVPIEAFLLGPTEEDPAYFEECEALVAMLGIGDRFTFTGRVNLQEWLARIDLNVLTSVSESQPLVILEAASSGVPTVASNVGACREMLEGKAGEDALLGPSGLITPVASPAATAAAILALAKDPARFHEMAAAGLARVERHYRQADVVAYYRRTYRELANQAPGVRPGAGGG